MSSAWNWLGIFIWLIIIAYLLWIIDNIHSRKKKLIKVAMNNKKHGLASDVSKNNFEIALFEVLILLVLLVGMGKTTHDHHIKDSNSIVTAQYRPLSMGQTKRNMKHPNMKVHNYYVMVRQSRSRDFKQKYEYAINGKKTLSSSSNSVIVNSNQQLKSNHNLTYMVNKALHRKSIWGKITRNRPAAVRVSTRFKNSAANGIGLHAGQKKFSFTIIKVPKGTNNGVYLNAKKLKKAKKVAPKN